MFNIEFNLWLVLGFLAQAMFASRFLVQWIISEKRKRSVIPIEFWFLSLAGGILLFIYAIHRQDPVFILGQGSGIIVYSRNLMLIYKRNKRSKKIQNARKEKQNGNADEFVAAPQSAEM